MSETTPTRRSIRVTLTWDEAEALLLDQHNPLVPYDPRVRLRARGKLTSALLAQRGYDPPLVRAAPHPQPEDESCGEADGCADFPAC